MSPANRRRAFLPGILACLVVAMAACEEVVPTPDHAPRNEALAQRYVEAWNARDLLALNDLLADPIVVNGDGEFRETFLEVVQEDWSAFPDLTLEPTHVVGADDPVTLRLELSGTGQGEWLGHDIDGREGHATEIILFGVEGERLTEYWYEWDELVFWEQLDVLESPWPPGLRNGRRWRR